GQSRVVPTDVGLLDRSVTHDRPHSFVEIVHARGGTAPGPESPADGDFGPDPNDGRRNAAERPGYGVVWTISTSVLERRATLAGTEPSNRPAMVLRPTLPTTSRSALTSSARSTRASTGAPTTAFSSILVAPAALARSLASRRIA